jgi:hypothetical protein
LFRYEYQRIIKLIEEYPILNQILLKTDHMWHKVLNIHHHDIVTQQTTLHLPLMLKPIKIQYNTIKNPPLLLTSTSKYNINTIDLQQVLMSCAVSPCVIAFSHRSKLDQAKAILHTHGIYNIGYTKPDQIILPQHLDQLVNQEEFQEYEVDFIIKYCSLLQQ